MIISSLSEKVLGQIASELELEKITQAIPISNTLVAVDDEDVKLLQVAEKFKGVNEFNVLSISTKKGLFFLVATELPFFEEKKLNDPFKESDDFFTFAEKIKKQLGLEFAQSYESSDGFFFTTAEINTKKLSFFLYKA